MCDVACANLLEWCDQDGTLRKQALSRRSEGCCYPYFLPGARIVRLS